MGQQQSLLDAAAGTVRGGDLVEPHLIGFIGLNVPRSMAPFTRAWKIGWR